MKGTIREYAIAGSDAGPYGITTGKDGALWYTEQKGNRIGRITGKGEMKSFPIPTPDAGAMTIVSDQSGDLWFTEYKANEPHGIAVCAEGNVWFAEECDQIACLLFSE